MAMNPHLGRLASPLLLALGLLAGCGKAEDAEDEQGPAPAVEAVPARRGTLPLEERLNGVVRADNQIAVRTEIEAPILEVLVRNGAAVERGQPLVRLEGDTLREQLRQAEANLELAQAAGREARARVAEVEAQVVRTRALAREDLVSAMDLEMQEAQLNAAKASGAQAAARVAQARATVEERRSALGKTVVRAPVAGLVGQRNAEVGMLAGPDEVLFVLGDVGDLVVEVPLTEEMLGYIRTGQPVRISSPALGRNAISATLTRISPFLEESSFSTTGEIDVANHQGRMRPGMFVTVDVLYGQSEQATLVPASALWEDPRTGVQGVFVVDGQGLAEPATAGGEIPQEPRKVELRPVEVLAEGRATVGVRGVQPGEWVVIVGQHLLARDGETTARVRPTRWERVLELQGLQREDLLQSFLDTQQEWARTRGAEPPTSEEFLGHGAPGRKEG
ncbi:MAG TPA: efflux RND transporter periplasmic adaptor subunit [Thermoanaerobaculia bacterium]|nr:efflux RND transporter periplasmic adaptor subunit [Thermoanaerobaculia bacterium]